MSQDTGSSEHHWIPGAELLGRGPQDPRSNRILDGTSERSFASALFMDHKNSFPNTPSFLRWYIASSTGASKSITRGSQTRCATDHQRVDIAEKSRSALDNTKSYPVAPPVNRFHNSSPICSCQFKRDWPLVIALSAHPGSGPEPASGGRTLVRDQSCV
jgi:hypothetical protein